MMKFRLTKVIASLIYAITFAMIYMTIIRENFYNRN